MISFADTHTHGIYCINTNTHTYVITFIQCMYICTYVLNSLFTLLERCWRLITCTHIHTLTQNTCAGDEFGSNEHQLAVLKWSAIRAFDQIDYQVALTDEMRYDTIRCDEMRWDEMKWLQDEITRNGNAFA